MDIKWLDELYRECKIMTDSWFEAEELADGMYRDFVEHRMVNVGYKTHDKKVYSYLCEHLPQWIGFVNASATVHTAMENTDGEPLYKIWLT